ncbi:hypothetical protein, partial [Stenotrophomonas sp. GbtcB23]|uniref:DUF6953 family protein n=1 Tax=Stenotrophomonas sp. GbtcB23 TaxID=2824768 RepID=UPI001C3067DC
MQAALKAEGCLYQVDVVDHLVKAGSDEFLRENADGNVVLSTSLLTAFRKLNANSVVWVKPGRYWRLRVPED